MYVYIYICVHTNTWLHMDVYDICCGLAAVPIGRRRAASARRVLAGESRRLKTGSWDRPALAGAGFPILGSNCFNQYAGLGGYSVFDPPSRKVVGNLARVLPNMPPFQVVRGQSPCHKGAEFRFLNSLAWFLVSANVISGFDCGSTHSFSKLADFENLQHQNMSPISS